MSEFAALRTDIETLRTDIERRFIHLESKIDQKPNITTIFLVMLITMVLTIGIVGTAAVLVIRETLSFEVLPSSTEAASFKHSRWPRRLQPDIGPLANGQQLCAPANGGVAIKCGDSK